MSSGRWLLTASFHRFEVEGGDVLVHRRHLPTTEVNGVIFATTKHLCERYIQHHAVWLSQEKKQAGHLSRCEGEWMDEFAHIFERRQSSSGHRIVESVGWVLGIPDKDHFAGLGLELVPNLGSSSSCIHFDLSAIDGWCRLQHHWPSPGHGRCRRRSPDHSGEPGFD